MNLFCYPHNRVIGCHSKSQLLKWIKNIIVGITCRRLSSLRTGPHYRGIGMAAIPKMKINLTKTFCYRQIFYLLSRHNNFLTKKIHDILLSLSLSLSLSLTRHWNLTYNFLKFGQLSLMSLKNP